MLLTSSVAVSPVWGQLPAKVLEQENRICLVRVPVDGSTGSGYIYDDKWIFTAYHVVRDGMRAVGGSENLRVDCSIGGRNFKARVAGLHKQYDYAVLQALEKQPFEPGVIGVVNDGDTVYGAGHIGGRPQYTWISGRVVNGKYGEDNLYTVGGQASPGQSGGPGFNENGELVGIVSAASEGDTFYCPLDKVAAINYLPKDVVYTQFCQPQGGQRIGGPQIGIVNRQGPVGPQGPPGNSGPQGPQGPPGANGQDAVITEEHLVRIADIIVERLKNDPTIVTSNLPSMKLHLLGENDTIASTQESYLGGAGFRIPAMKLNAVSSDGTVQRLVKPLGETFTIKLLPINE